VPQKKKIKKRAVLFIFKSTNMKKLFLFSLIFISLHTLAQSDSIPSFVKDSLDSYVNKALTDWQIPGVSV
jgi:hypothetical protein